MNYQQSWEFLDSLQFFKIKLGLDSMTMFLDELGRPHERLRFIHVAGTNGKGSVAATLLAILARAGFRVGLYTSPHLSSVRERFRINEEFIPPDEFAAHATAIRDILAGRQITYFEFTTALALLWFAQRQVDVAIMEVGLGGRLDATNVITPLVSVITNISMDHEAYLGNTIAEIASEKAGIIKAGVPVVSGVGPTDWDRSGAALRVIDNFCARLQAPLYLHGRDFFAEPAEDHAWNYWGMKRRQGRCMLRQTMTALPCRLPGRHQLDNAALALACLELLASNGLAVDESAIRNGLTGVCWPGRLEYFRLALDPGAPPHAYMLDGAHNPAGVLTLKQALQADFNYRQLILIWAAMADKDLHATLPEITPLAQHVILTRPESERAATPELLKTMVPPADRAKIECVPTVAEALSRAAALAAPDDLICIAGSLYLVGAARQLLLGELA